jgi:hypothetical protein
MKPKRPPSERCRSSWIKRSKISSAESKFLGIEKVCRIDLVIRQLTATKFK